MSIHLKWKERIRVCRILDVDMKGAPSVQYKKVSNE